MSVVRGDAVLRFIRKLAVRELTSRLRDRELLEGFAKKRDEEAFVMLVRRHGPMVLRVCLGVLDNEHDAEDAFQATFLVLSRKASAIKKQESIGSWLFGVANHAATNLKRNLARRRRHEKQVREPSVAGPLAALTMREAQTILNQELARLPEKYRAPLVLCTLEGLTRDEAAHQLGLRLGTLKNRLEQARKRLRGRLASRGLTLSGAFVASVFCEQMAPAAIPAELVNLTVKAAVSVAARSAITSVVSAKVAALTEGVLKTMFMTKLKVAMAVLLTVGFIVAGTGILTSGGRAAQQADPSGASTSEVRAIQTTFVAHAKDPAFRQFREKGAQGTRRQPQEHAVGARRAQI
jgi:RNA polymerase sigma factor (sigma-70 family)